jgi:hypothetical protein
MSRKENSVRFHPRLAAVAALTSFFLFTSVAVARPPALSRTAEIPRAADSSDQSWALPETSEARLELWTASLQRFLDSHPNLPDEQRAVLEDAWSSANPGLFADNPDPRQKAKIAETLLALKKTLYCTKYAEIFQGFQGLGTWLKMNRVVAAFEGQPCNCGAGGCGEGYSCISSGCFAEIGTTNYGRCVYTRPSGGDPPNGGL